VTPNFSQEEITLMTKLVKTLGLLGAAALTSMSLSAATADTLHFRAPFSFVFAGQEFASGDYNIQETENGVLFVQGEGRGAAALSVPEGYTKAGAPTGVRFQKSEDRQHLVGLQVEGENSRSVVMPAQDRKIAFTH
jgi:hypothetical protein